MLGGNPSGPNLPLQALWPNAKLIASAAVTMVGTIATLRQNVSALTAKTTLRSTKEKEEAHLADLLDLRRKLDGFDPEKYVVVRRQADSEVNESSERLSSLMNKELELSQDPNYKLSLAERLFLLFRPVGARAEIIHFLAYFFMFGFPLLILVRTAYSRLEPEMYADLIVLTTFAGLGFRAWALAERRWAAGLETKPRAVTTLFLLNKPVNNGMRVAQLFLWVCLFCAVESLEDVFFRLASGGHVGDHRLFGPTVLFTIFLLGAALCRAWGAAELDQQGHVRVQRLWATFFPGPRNAPPKVWLVRIVFLTALFLPMLLLLKGNVSSGESFFADHLDQAELVFLWVASSVAGNRWLNLLSLRGIPVKVVPEGSERLFRCDDRSPATSLSQVDWRTVWR